jgi:peptidoglycan/xylan/chitin deacetylase (PgdA/CDA1 family)
MALSVRVCPAAVGVLLVAAMLGGVTACAGSRTVPRPPAPPRLAAGTRGSPAARRPRTGPVAVSAPTVSVPARANRCPAAPYGPQLAAPGSGRTVALTFDDGPGRSTAAIVDILTRFRVPATFFNIGRNMAGRAALVREEARDGFTLGDHTWSHPHLITLPAASQATQLDEVRAEQWLLTGTVPCVFRPPYGGYDTTTLGLARQRRLAVWMWSADTQDWMARGSDSAAWVTRIIRLAESLGGAQTHPVVLMHNQATGNPATVSALPTIIQYFRSHGYRFVAL